MMHTFLIAYKLKPRILQNLDTFEPGIKSHFIPIMLLVHFNAYYRLLLVAIAVEVSAD